jgi:hypothetical protein
MLRRSQESCPVVRPSCCWDRGDDFCHAERDGHCEERDHDPADGHDSGTACNKSILEEGRDAGDY